MDTGLGLAYEKFAKNRVGGRTSTYLQKRAAEIVTKYREGGATTTIQLREHALVPAAA